jgi:hypothetical protein
MKKFIITSASFLLPVVALAQVSVTGNLTTISSFINRLQSLINIIIPFLIGIAVLVIIYGILGYVMSAGNEEKRGEAKQFIIWGFIGVFIMLSVWGLINILINSFGTDTGALRATGVIEGRTGVPVVSPAVPF